MCVSSYIYVLLNLIDCVVVPLLLPLRHFEEDITIVLVECFVGGFIALGSILIF
jgi:hypothetical protein